MGVQKTDTFKCVLPGEIVVSRRTTIGEAGETVIPRDLRRKYGLESGDELLWIEADDGLLVTKWTPSEARGTLVPDDLPEEKRKAVADELVRRTLRRRRNDVPEE